MNVRLLRLMRAAPVWIAVLVVSSGCKDKSQTEAPAPPAVSFVTVQHTAVPLTTELPGRTSPHLVAQVRARVDGIVQQRLFQEGADVTANQTLYQIDRAPYEAALESAQAQLARARANVESTTVEAERDAVLVDANAVSRQMYLNAVASQRQAAADVAAGLAAVKVAGINLGYTNVVAPITGRIGPALVTQGAYVQASAATLMAVIQEIDPIYVDLNETSLEGLQLRRQVASGRLKLIGPEHAEVRLLLEDQTEYPHAGRLQFSDITVDAGTGSVTVRAIFPNPNKVLLPGMFVRARIAQGSEQRAALVPQEGVTHDRKGRATVLIVGADDKVSVRTVVATRVFGSNWVVESGLNDGDRVIVEGVQGVQPGMTVRAKQMLARTTRTEPLQPAAQPLVGR
jgi:membrane fusion protein (multidrug efflux system)